MKFTITGHVSRHNAPRDHVDDATWQLMIAKINQLISSTEFERLNLSLTGNCENITYGVKHSDLT